MSKVVYTEVLPLSGNGKKIVYSINEIEMEVIWSKTKFTVTQEMICKILDVFFSADKWYPLGASIDQPIPDGLGAFIRDNDKSLSPRHATAIAAIFVEEHLLEYKGRKPIYLRKLKDISSDKLW